MATYNNDYMHCSQHQCKKKKDCYRYWLGTHAKGIASYFLPEKNVDDGCEYFLELKGW